MPIFIAISYRIFILFTHGKLGSPKGIPPKGILQDEWNGTVPSSRSAWSVNYLVCLSVNFYSQVDCFRREATFGAEGAVLKFGLPGDGAGIAGCVTWEGLCGWWRAGTAEGT